MERGMKTTWFEGIEYPANDLVKAAIRTHIVATQEYDHVTAALIEKFLKEYANRYESTGMGDL